MSSISRASILTQAARTLARHRAGRRGWSIADPHGKRRVAEVDDELMKAAALRLFQRTDADGSGTISRSEYEAVLGFEKLNTNSDAVLSKSEFLGLYSSGSRRGGLRSLDSQAARAAAVEATAAAVATGQSVASLTAAGTGSATTGAISSRQYALLALKSGLPFVAFGFVDNAIMIIAGDQIEASIGVALSLSTMAAAGLGNTFSDVIGIAASDRIESLVEMAGLPSAALTASQLRSTGARRVHLLAQVVGIVLGCLLGLCPLLAIDQESKALKAAFEDADTNGNGSLDAAEVERALHRYGLMMDAEEVRWLIRRCDKHHANSVDFCEFSELVRHWVAYNSEYQKSKGKAQADRTQLLK